MNIVGSWGLVGLGTVCLGNLNPSLQLYCPSFRCITAFDDVVAHPCTQISAISMGSVFELVRTRLCFCTGSSLCFQRTQNPLCCFDVDGHLDPLPSALHRLITWQFITVSSGGSQSPVEYFRSSLWWPFTAGTSTKCSSRLGFFSSFSYAPQCTFTGRIWLSLSGLWWLLKDFSFNFSKRARHRVTSRECFLGSAESWSCSLGQAQIF